MKKAMKNWKFTYLITVFLLSLGITSQAQEEKIQLTLLHTNDHHGHFWTNSKGEWGMPARSTLIKQLRQEVKEAGGHTLLLSGGDVNTGTPESDMVDAKPDFEGMRYLKYDAMAVGNHEFDNDLEVLKQQQQWAGFPFLSANIYLKGSDERFFQPYIIKEIAGFKIAILGLTTDDTPNISLKFPKDKLELRSPIEEAKKLIPLLQEKADFIIAVTHMGHYANGEHGSLAPGDVTLARSVEGLDVIIGGHSQNPIFEADFQNDTIIVQAQDYGKYLGRVDFEITKNSRKLVNYQLIPINHQDESGEIKNRIAEDQVLKTKLQPYFESAEQLLSEEVGESSGFWNGDRKVIRKQETTLGNLITSTMKEAAEADVSFLASGLIRSSLEAGPITMGTVLNIMPFNLELVTLEYTGKELLDFLSSLTKIEPGDGAYPQMSGIKMVFEDSKITQAQVQGADGVFQNIEENLTYKIALTDFNAKGGGNFPVVTEHASYEKTGLIDADVFVNFIRSQQSISPEDFPVTNRYIRK